MNKGDRAVFSLMILLSLGFGGAAVNLMYQQHRTEEVARKKQFLAVRADDVIGPSKEFQGDSNSPYTLVEFGDYQCPPCRSTQKRLPQVMQKYRGKVRLAFRNMPLTVIHPFAMQAALAAEAARAQGRFWPVHDTLFQEKLSTAALQHFAAQQHLDNARFKLAMNTVAKTAVQRDIKQADALGLDSTPTFLLCCPNGQVVHLNSLEQLPEFIPT